MNSNRTRQVVFLGAPSTGKTTLAKALAHHYRTVWMPEYGREYWELHQSERRLTLEQLKEIAEGHIEREENLLPQACRFLFIDTDATTTYMFSMYYHGTAHPRLEGLAAATRQRYDFFFLCEADIPYDATWDRSGEMQRAEMQEQIRTDLIRRNIPFISLYGTLETRIARVIELLERPT